MDSRFRGNDIGGGENNPSLVIPGKRGDAERDRESISLSVDLIVKIIPIWIHRFNEFNLPRAVPFLELFLADNGFSYVIECFHIDQSMDTIFLGETVCKSVLVFIGTPRDVIGHANIECALFSNCKDINRVGHSVTIMSFKAQVNGLTREF